MYPLWSGKFWSKLNWLHKIQDNSPYQEIKPSYVIRAEILKIGESRFSNVLFFFFLTSLRFPWKFRFVLNTKENDDILLVLSNSSLLIKSESSSWSDDQGCMHRASVDVLLLPPNSNSIWLLEKHYTNIFNWQWDMTSSENKSQDALHMPYTDVVRTDTIVAKNLPGKTHSRKLECLWKAFCSFSIFTLVERCK